MITDDANSCTEYLVGQNANEIIFFLKIPLFSHLWTVI